MNETPLPIIVEAIITDGPNLLFSAISSASLI
jgi:hypothetical protein